MIEATPEILALYPKAVVYVPADDFDRVTAERDDLQKRLNVQDQLVDDLRGWLEAWLCEHDDGKGADSSDYLVASTYKLLNPTTEPETTSDRGHCKSCAMEYSAANHPVCPICTRTTEAGDIWPAVKP